MQINKTIALTVEDQNKIIAAFDIIYDLWSSLHENESVETNDRFLEYDEIETAKIVLYELSLTDNRTTLIR